MDLYTSDIAKISNSRLIGPPDILVTDLATDSRQVNFTDHAAFIAIEGKNHDGHLFIDALYLKGIRVFVVNRLPADAARFSDAAFILNSDTVEVLQQLAAFKREKSRTMVIAITGSAGKTIVKEWLADILGRTAAVIRSPKSYNSQIGVPLSVWKLEDKYKFGIFEAGISQPGEMEKLRQIINPSIGIITNIGDAHNENFPDAETKGREKLKLFTEASSIIYCSDQVLLKNLILTDPDLRNKEVIDWSVKNPEAAVYVRLVQQKLTGTRLEFTYKGKTFESEIPFSDRASIENAIAVASTCLFLGIDLPEIRTGLSQLVSVAMRMEMKSGINNCNLIEDYYNSDPGSLVMALEYLKLQNNKKTTLILSDFIQSGRNEHELYNDLAGLLRKSCIDKFIGIGEALVRNGTLFGGDASFYHSTDEFIYNFSSLRFRDEVILIKGARVFELEKIGKLLEQQMHSTILEINLDAISHNLNEFRRHLNPGTRIMAMVKAFAYGAGPAEIAGLLEYHRINYLAVAYVDEGVELRNAGVSLPVMIMNPDPYSFDLVIKYNLEPEIYSFSSLSKFAEVASRHGLYDYPVHIKIDTGMHRLGFMPEDISELTDRLKRIDCLRITTVFSHLAASENPALDQFTHHQVGLFLPAVSKIREATGYPFLVHILNTAGIVRFPQYQFDMVRPGIGIYGIGNLEGLALRPAGRFTTRVSQVKRIPAGDPVGYGCSDISDKERIIAILPAGYADGLNRKLGNRNGNLYMKGRKVSLVGNICMDMCMVDVTGLNVTEGDEAEIFGSNIKVDELAEQCGTIPYEIITSIPGRVQRVFFRE